jgi:hypothetical protein
VYIRSTSATCIAASTCRLHSPMGAGTTAVISRTPAIRAGITVISTEDG